MRPVTPAGGARGRQAEPGRLRRRLNRLWRRRWVRRAATTHLPALALAAAAAMLASDPAVHAAAQAKLAEARAALTARPEFAIRRIEVAGADAALEGEILAALTDATGASSLDLDPAVVRRRVESLGWVAGAEVHLEAPEALRVIVRQRRAAAIWRIEGEPVLIDAGGAVIEPAFSRGDHPELPLVVGPGAAEAVSDALAVLTVSGPLRPRVVALTRIGARRWDVALLGPAPGETMTLMLPETGAPAAMAQAARMHERIALFDRDLAAVDLRLPGRPTVRLTERALTGLQKENQT